MTKVSQFYKTILLLVLAVVCFLGFKEVLPERLFPETRANDPSMLIDSVLLDLLGSTNATEAGIGANLTKNISAPSSDADEANLNIELKTFKKSNFVKKLEQRKPALFLPDEVTKIVTERPVADTLLDPTISVQGYGYLQRFYSKLRKLKETGKGKVRIAYFGDSMNDGDLIVQDFRILLQDEFGGNGVGYVSITSLSAASRGSVFHQYSDNWTTQSFITTKSPKAPFGVDGQVFWAGEAGSWVNYTAGNIKNSPMLYNPTLFYGQSSNNEGYVNINVNKEGVVKKELDPSSDLNLMNLGANYAKTVRLNFENVRDIPIYGFDFSSYNGVYVDNFSLRGNSGLTLVGLNTGLMHAFNRVLNYDLIVLHYGTNVLNYGSLDYSFYERGMKAVINKLRNCFPNADILVISTADKASKIDMKMTTDPSVLALTKAQKSFSREVGAGFIDLYSLMGGYGSMVDWVNKKLANMDYTHFNVRGSKEVGTLLFGELERGYNKYNTQLNKEIERSNRNN